MTLMDPDEINERLDGLAHTIAENGGTSELLNAVHACRPRHPLSGRVRAPFANLKFMLAGRGFIDGWQHEWLTGMARLEARILERSDA